MKKFKMKRVFVFDLIAILISTLVAFALFTMIVASIYNGGFISIYALVLLSSLLGTALSWIFNTKCYIENDILHVNFMLFRKIIPIDKIKEIKTFSGHGFYSKMVKDGICIVYEGKFSEMEVVTALKDEEEFISYVENKKA
ncbi:MAG: PH domain-containing protein [Bacilli bacterium]